MNEEIIINKEPKISGIEKEYLNWLQTRWADMYYKEFLEQR